MTAPALATGRFCAACLIGMALGFVYDFLRPLRPRLTTLSDLLFLLALTVGWVYLGFGICRGDLRFGYTAGMLLGILLWEKTAGKVLRPMFSGFWRPFQKFFAFFGKNIKKLFASRKKKVTIENREKCLTGGKRHGKAGKADQPDSLSLSSK